MESCSREGDKEVHLPCFLISESLICRTGRRQTSTTSNRRRTTALAPSPPPSHPPVPALDCKLMPMLFVLVLLYDYLSPALCFLRCYIYCVPADELAGNDVETRLRVEQEAGVAALAATAEIQKKELQRELSRTGATTEDKEVPTELQPTVVVNGCRGCA